MSVNWGSMGGGGVCKPCALAWVLIIVGVVIGIVTHIKKSGCAGCGG